MAIKKPIIGKSKKLILVRHGHRDNIIQADNNGLTPKGWEQAQDLRKVYEAKLMDKAVRLFSSPKLRCIETLEPLTAAIDGELEVNPLLDEQGPREDMAPLIARIDQFLGAWIASPESVWVACSHGDWIPMVVEKLTGSVNSIKKGQWVEIKLTVSI